MCPTLLQEGLATKGTSKKNSIDATGLHNPLLQINLELLRLRLSVTALRKTHRELQMRWHANAWHHPRSAGCRVTLWNAICCSLFKNKSTVAEQEFRGAQRGNFSIMPTACSQVGHALSDRGWYPGTGACCHAAPCIGAIMRVHATQIGNNAGTGSQNLTRPRNPGIGRQKQFIMLQN